jgi:hypothetical protein
MDTSIFQPGFVRKGSALKEWLEGMDTLDEDWTITCEGDYLDLD